MAFILNLKSQCFKSLNYGKKNAISLDLNGFGHIQLILLLGFIDVLMWRSRVDFSIAYFDRITVFKGDMPVLKPYE